MDCYKTYFDANRAHWNAATLLHLGPGEVYDVEAFKRGESTLQPVERAVLGDVAGRTILHAQCHFGLDSMSLARLGAKVTGVDFSEEAIRAARSLNAELGLDCRFVCCNIYALPSHVHEQFDIAFADYGVLCWLPDLPLWCRLLADRLRPGGTLVLLDGHPFSMCLDDGRVCRDYFPPPGPEFCPPDEEGDCDYHATSTPVGKTTYEWAYTVADIINAVAAAGLTIRSFGEHPEIPYRLHPDMTKGPDRLFRFPPGRPRYPLVFSIKAVKP